MLIVSVNEPELLSIEHIRLALSETTPESREKAITNAKHAIMALRLNVLSNNAGSDWMSEPQNTELAHWIVATLSERDEASYEFYRTARRYEDGNERKLNVAEHIGKLIYLSIHDKKFEGVHTGSGILQQVRNQALESGISGAKDLDVLRTIWKTYRGVVHLGMAIDYCDENPDPAQNVLNVAENFRRVLRQSCPKGTREPYVPEDSQIKFNYLSMIYGPRFRDRGLPFAIT